MDDVIRARVDQILREKIAMGAGAPKRCPKGTRKVCTKGGLLLGGADPKRCPNGYIKQCRATKGGLLLGGEYDDLYGGAKMRKVRNSGKVTEEMIIKKAAKDRRDAERAAAKAAKKPRRTKPPTEKQLAAWQNLRNMNATARMLRSETPEMTWKEALCAAADSQRPNCAAAKEKWY